MSSTEELLDFVSKWKRFAATIENADGGWSGKFDELSNIVKRYGDIVHCGECQRWKPDGSYGLDLDGTKQPYGACAITHCYHKETHFCSYGERRDKEGDK